MDYIFYLFTSFISSLCIAAAYYGHMNPENYTPVSGAVALYNGIFLGFISIMLLLGD